MALDGASAGEVAGTYCEEHGSKNYAPAPRNRVAPVAFESAYLLAFPWTISARHDLPSYPGRDAATIELFGTQAQIETVRSWRKGHRAAPKWACDLLANHLRQSAMERLRAADELQKERGAS